MKNIHILPTDKPSKLFYNVGGALLFTNYENHNGVNIYITSDEEIKIGDYYLCKLSMKPLKCTGDEYFNNVDEKKIILTTDQDLIKDGVQAIDDEFLEWFVKNPSCEEVEVKFIKDGWCLKEAKEVSFYKIIFQKEEPKQETFVNEKCFKCGRNQYSSRKPFCTDDFCNKDFYQKPKQETLEESAEKSAIKQFEAGNDAYILGFIEGAKWQAERMYSEEDMKESFYQGWVLSGAGVSFKDALKKWFE